MSRYYEPEFKQKIVRLHLEEGRTIKSFDADERMFHCGTSFKDAAIKLTTACISAHFGIV